MVSSGASQPSAFKLELFLQIGTGAQTFDEFLDAVCPLSLSSEEDIFWVLIILSSDLTTVELAHLKSSDVRRRRKEMPLADH